MKITNVNISKCRKIKEWLTLRRTKQSLYSGGITGYWEKSQYHFSKN